MAARQVNTIMTYKLVVYQDDGSGATSAITAYSRDETGQLAYMGREWLDSSETAAVVTIMTRTRARRALAAWMEQ